MEDIYNRTYEYILDSPNIGLYIPPFNWRTIKFTHDAVLLCLASDTFNEDDYIRDKNEFDKLKKNEV